MTKLPAKKSLGQHFLVDPKYHARIAAALAVERGDWVLEIGPGTGLLTQHLLGTPLEKLIAYEIDSRAVPILQEKFGSDVRFEVRERDFLEVSISALAAEAGKKLRVAGNIPYYITSPILFKLIDERAGVRNAVLLVQQEVAERLTAKPRTKSYGIPTVFANFFGETELLFRVPRGAFRPVPKVDSALIRIDFSNDYFLRSGTSLSENFDEAGFRKFVRAMFATRRKTVRNNLKAFISPDVLDRLAASAEARFLIMRPEELTIADFLELFRALMS